VHPGAVPLSAWRAIYRGGDAALDDACRPAIEAGAATVRRILKRDEPVYGINTGFGRLASIRIGAADLAALQRNIVLSHAAGESVFFISNDIFVTPIYLRTLLAAAHANPRLGILRGSSNFVDNCGLATHNLDFGKPITNWHQLFEAGEHFAQKFGQAAYKDPFLVGDAFLVTRPLLAHIGSFDPSFYGYFADPDYGLRAQIAGFELALVPGAFAYHQREANLDYLPDAQRKEKIDRRMMRVYENWARFKMKYGLPVSMPYESIVAIPWERLAHATFDPARHYSAPGDYRRFLA